MSQSKAGVASGIARRAKTDEMKRLFIEAVKNGAALTKTGLVNASTYQKWRKQDVEFSNHIDALVKARPKPVVFKRKRKSRAKIYGASALNSLNSVGVYVQAVTLLKGRHLAPDIRESAISELVLMILSGEKPNAGKAVHLAKAEFLPHGRYSEYFDEGY